METAGFVDYVENVGAVTRSTFEEESVYAYQIIEFQGLRKFTGTLVTRLS